uniref:ZF(Bbox/RING/PHD)-1 zinc finger protein n=1 Tax=Phallusia mammillata TaxID=59560 RepID=A0A6F9DVS8_9ASCI|nr:ZF(Bbox/RING/PHD)-1 zinc finger protein [Phallusia mammillata]
MDETMKRPSDGENLQPAKVFRSCENTEITILLEHSPSSNTTTDDQSSNNSKMNSVPTLNKTPTPETPNSVNDDNSASGSVAAVDSMSLSSEDASTTTGEQDRTESNTVSHVCTLCEQPFMDKNPLLLGCLHVFCTKCILKQEHISYQKELDGLHQKGLRNDVEPPIPEDALENLQKIKVYQRNVCGELLLKCPCCQCISNLDNVIDNLFTYQQNNKTSASEENIVPKVKKLCTSCDENYQAVRFCSTCEDFLCEECMTAHKRVKLTKDHVLDPVDEDMLSEGHFANSTQPVCCKMHPGEVIKLCCETCNVLTCRDCQLEKHQEHKYKFIEEAAAVERTNLELIQEELKIKTDSIGSLKQDISKNLKSIEECQKAVLRQVLMYHYELHQLITQKSQTFLNEIKTVSEQRVKVLETQMTIAKRMENSVNHCIKFIAVARQKQNEFALLQSRKMVSCNVKKIKEFATSLEKEIVETSPAIMDVVFFPDDTVKETLENCLGQLFWTAIEKKPVEPEIQPSTAMPNKMVDLETTTNCTTTPDKDKTINTPIIPNTNGTPSSAFEGGAGLFTNSGIFEKMQKLYPTRHQHFQEASAQSSTPTTTTPVATNCVDQSPSMELNSTASEHDNTQKSDDLQPPDLLDLTDVERNEYDDTNNMMDTSKITDMVFDLAKHLDENFSDSPTTTQDSPGVIITKPHDEEIKCDPNEDWCAVCKNGGKLLCCDSCPKVYHLHCHIPAMDSEPKGFWQCSMCRDPLTHYNYGFTGIPNGLQGEEQHLCEQMLLHLLCQPESLHFQEPVSASVPKYYKVIKKPIDLKKIRQRLDQSNSAHYGNVEALIKDMQLLFTNCYVFNGENSQLGKQARSLQKTFFERILLYFPNMKPYLSELVIKQKATLEEALENAPSDDDTPSNEEFKRLYEQDELWQPGSDEENSDIDIRNRRHMSEVPKTMKQNPFIR